MTSLLVLAALGAALLGAPHEETATCLRCHRIRSPAEVDDWEGSRHARAGVGCRACHGSDHGSERDAARAALPTAETCGACHAAQFAGWRGGKHARAWVATERATAFRHASAPSGAERRACLDCHRVGLATADLPGVRAAGAEVGLLACTACHASHAFSRLAARQPQTCARCHAYLHPQWNAWATSPHGAAQPVHGGRVDGAAPATPTCQQCHFHGGSHAQRTPWGTLGLPLTAPADPAWAADRAVLLRALRVLEAGGADGALAEGYREAGLGPLDRVEHQLVRSAMGNACRDCHSARLVRETWAKREAALREADRLTADAVRAMVPLYEAGALPGDYPDLSAARSGFLVERRLAEMVFDHRSRFVAAVFHGSPTADQWLATLVQDREDVRRMALGLMVPPARGK